MPFNKNNKNAVINALSKIEKSTEFTEFKKNVISSCDALISKENEENWAMLFKHLKSPKSSVFLPKADKNATMLRLQKNYTEFNDSSNDQEEITLSPTSSSHRSTPTNASSDNASADKEAFVPSYKGAIVVSLKMLQNNPSLLHSTPRFFGGKAIEPIQENYAMNEWFCSK